MGKRRFFTKTMSIVLTFVMIVTMLPAFAVTSQAEGTGVALYFKLPDGTTVADWAVNVWTNVTVKGNEEVTLRPTAWGDGEQLQTLLPKEGLDGWGYVTLEGDIEGIQFVKKDSSGEIPNRWNASITTEGYQEAYFDPADEKWYTSAEKEKEIKAPEIRNIFVIAGDDGLVTGDAWSPTNMSNELKNIEGTNQYSITYKNVAVKTYSYKILQDPENKGWDLTWGTGSGSDGNRSLKVAAPADVTFTIDLDKPPAADSVDEGVDVQFDYIESIVADNKNIAKGKEVELKTTGTYYDTAGKATEDVALTYQLKTAVDGVTLKDNKITVADEAEAEEVSLIVTAEGIPFQQEITIPVVSKVYKVTINMYSPDLDMEPGISDIYIFENKGGGNAEMALTGTVADEENGVTWVTGTMELPFNSLGMIARDKAGSWNDGQDADQFYEIPEDTEEITLWYEYGKTPVTEKPTIVKAAPRYFILEYENPDFPARKTPQFYSWTTGYKAERIDFESRGNGKWTVKVQVKPSCTKVDFVLVIDASGSDWVKDGGDHSISFPLDQNLVYASMKANEEPQLSVPYNIGYELQPKEDQITFYYRDDNALLEGTLANQTPQIELDGTKYDMKYVEAEKRFAYVKKGLTDGRMRYRYYVEDPASDGGSDKVYILDKYNANVEVKDETEYSYVEYYKLEATVTAAVMNPSFNYNENDVVRFEVNQKKTAGQPDFQVKTASIDVSALGGSKELAITPDLQAVTISATIDTPLGKKTLPIVITDQYQNEFTTSVEVEVVKREKTDEKDFDWDEACIYFMVTDRFFDGNATNNKASDAEGISTYGKNDGLYHGGDFAGVTQKLDYLEDLGINTIWITPIVENIPGVKVTGADSVAVPYNSAYHGYWASDFTKLNPTLGTEEEFKTMIEEAHKRGIRIMVDIVLNHAGYAADFGDMIRSGSDIVSGDDQKDSLAGLPDFRTEDPEVSAKLVEWQTQWIKNYAIDYFRVDTVKHVEGDTWAELKNSLTAVNPSFKMIGEYSGAGYASNGGSLGSGQMDSDLDFDFNGQATSFVSGNIEAVEKFMVSRNAALNNTYLTGQFIGSHDEDGFKYNLINGNKMSEEEADAASLVAATLQITAKGQPVIYYGEEIGQTGANNYPYQTNRYDFDWNETTNEDNVTLKHYKKLLQIRKDYVDVFARGDRESINANDRFGYDIVKRTYGDDSLLIGMNIKDQAISVAASVEADTSYKDLYSGKVVRSNANGVLLLELPKSSEGGTAIYVKTTEDPSKPEEPKPEEPKSEEPKSEEPKSEEPKQEEPKSEEPKSEEPKSEEPKSEEPKSEEPKSEEPKSEEPKSEEPKSEEPKSEDTQATGTPIKVTDLWIDAAYTEVAAGKSVRLEATVAPENATNSSLIWTSNNDKYATVKDGKVTTKKAGAGKIVTITAAAADGSGVMDTYNIKIMKHKVTKIKLSASTKSVKAGKTLTIKTSVKTSGKSANKTLKWSSSNTNYATVTQKGVIKTKKAGKGKKVTITARSTDGTNKRGTIKIKITK